MKDFIYILVSFIAFSAGCSLGIHAEAANGEYWHKEAIAHQAAHYDAKTGAFTWDLPEQK